MLAGLAGGRPSPRAITAEIAGRRSRGLRSRASCWRSAAGRCSSRAIVDLNAVVAGLERHAAPLDRRGHRARASRSAGSPAVRADPGQLEQVLLNLVVNARDAMPDGGGLTIETPTARGRRYAAGIPATGRPALRDARRAYRHRRRHGRGRSGARIFEPFFTTKAIGKGTGLGLSMVYGIVKQSGGSIWFHSEPGHGAAFTIYLPAGARDRRRGSRAAARRRWRRHETLLVVEDEPPLRELPARILTTAGYTRAAGRATAPTRWRCWSGTPSPCTWSSPTWSCPLG